mgnify:CR=1 FL=1
MWERVLQRLDFVVGNNELEIGDILDEGVSFTIERPRAKVGTDAAPEVLGLPDIDHLTRRIFVKIDAGRGRNFLEPFFNSHDVILT